MVELGPSPRPSDSISELLLGSAWSSAGDLTTQHSQSKDRTGFQGEGGEVLGTCSYLQDVVWVAACRRGLS
jgi:hypothetical protein